MLSWKESISRRDKFLPCSITRGINNEIIPIDIGTHDEVY